mmetsp:Transcript_28724/g.50540  ORF Transcript_28724/g.50540 Transcript_28724/m.50540 type:complete len:119 (+) Transcript_28724:182-538(+)
MTVMSTFFTGYEVSRRALGPEGLGIPNAMTSFLAGGIAGTIFWTIAFPIEAVKNRLMTQPLDEVRYSGFMHCLKDTVRRQGVSGLYSGFSPAMLRTFPASGATFLAYELVSRALKTLL